MEDIYECVIIGGGFAGLSAAIFLSRFNRSTLVIGNEFGRWDTFEINENYPGFPHGIPVRELRRLMMAQAKRFGAIYKHDEVRGFEREGDMFISLSKNNKFISKSLILATGVVDMFPDFTSWKEYLGKTLFWCITCDGHKAVNKKVVMVGNDNDAASTCLQFLTYTEKMTFVTNEAPGSHTISKKWLNRFEKFNIPFYDKKIDKFKGENGILQNIELQDGKEILLDYMFSEQGILPNNELAIELNVKLSHDGYIITDKQQRTNVPFVYAAGDVTKSYDQQITSAVHEGSTAAESANYDLYPEWQRL